MITISAIFLTASAITVDPETICVQDKSKSAVVERYAHCKKGDLINVDNYGYTRLCDFKSGTSSSNDRRNPVICVYRGKARNVKLAPGTQKARDDYKKKKEQLEKSGRKKL